ncbi:MAG: metallophosphoesterase family protein [Hyphomicrobiales bacterium]
MDDAIGNGRGQAASERARPAGPRSLPPGERVYAVGDIHGRADLLEEMQDIIAVHAAHFPPQSVTVVWLGDYVDRGPSSREVIDLLIRFAEQRHRSIFLMGNHEEALLRFLIDPRDGHQWRLFGGIETLASYGVDTGEFRFGRGFGEARTAFLAALPPPHQEFLLSLKFSGSIGDFFFCHAGVRPGVELEAQDPQDLIWIRDEFLYWAHDFGMTIVHGHTPVPEPELWPNRVNVDTGAYATGRLTCAVIEGSDIAFLSTEPR